MKVFANQYLQFLDKNCNNFNIIFLYGTNNGLINLLYRDTIKNLKIDETNPFSVSRIDGNELKENPSVLSDNLSTISIFGEKKYIILNLLYSIIYDSLITPINRSVLILNYLYFHFPFRL